MKGQIPQRAKPKIVVAMTDSEWNAFKNKTPRSKKLHAQVVELIRGFSDENL